MKGKLAGRSAATGVAIVLSVLLGAMWSRAQSVSPIRFDEPSEELAGAVVGNGQRIDAEFFRATSIGGEVAETLVPRGMIAGLCGDGDGCTLRMLIDRADPQLIRVWGVLFATDAQGLNWSLQQGNGSFDSGTVTDLNDETILVFGLPPPCTLAEKRFPSALSSSYVVRAERSSHECTLRIDD